MKKYYGIALLILVISITGCNAEKTDTEIETGTGAEGESDITLMQQVLLNEEELHDGRRITDFEGIYVESSDNQSRVFYYVVDFDGDGINEVCVENEETGAFIFHEKAGEIYGYEWTLGKIDEYYYDGTISTKEEGKYHTYYGNISFSETDIICDVIASEYYESEDTVYYCKNAEYGEAGSVEITKAEYNAIENRYEIMWGAFRVSGCLNEENILTDVTREAMVLPEIVFEVDVPEDELSLMQKVLLNKEYFNEGLWIGEVEGIYLDEYDSKDSFIVVDLDGDEVEEVCICYGGGSVLILHEENGSIYGYPTGFRAFYPVYQDGTYESSAGASHHIYYGNVSFADNVFSSEIITFRIWDNEEPYMVHYYTDGETDTTEGIEITEEEYNQIMSHYKMEQVPEYELTVENILCIVK